MAGHTACRFIGGPFVSTPGCWLSSIYTPQICVLSPNYDHIWVSGQTQPSLGMVCLKMPRRIRTEGNLIVVIFFFLLNCFYLSACLSIYLSLKEQVYRGIREVGVQSQVLLGCVWIGASRSIWRRGVNCHYLGPPFALPGGEDGASRDQSSRSCSQPVRKEWKRVWILCPRVVISDPSFTTMQSSIALQRVMESSEK